MPHRPLLPSRFALPALLVILPILAGCSPQEAATPPQALLGTFEDDHGARYTITDSTWTHGSSSYRVEAWDPEAEYLLLTSGDAGDLKTDRRWMRIDWVFLDEDGIGEAEGSSTTEARWEWAHCMVAWDKESEGAALAAPAPDRSAPRVGCGDGFPFSRMKGVDGEGSGTGGGPYAVRTHLMTTLSPPRNLSATFLPPPLQPRG